jgi:hypothetical protein
MKVAAVDFPLSPKSTHLSSAPDCGWSSVSMRLSRCRALVRDDARLSIHVF